MSNSSNKQVWIIDDDPIARLLIKKTLERTGIYSGFKEWGDARVFTKILLKIQHGDEKEPNLIILDINMPGFNGWEVLDFILDKEIILKKAKLYLLTSSIDPDDKAKAKNYGFLDGYLNKPLRTRDVESFDT